ncbi:hypothetical protein KJ966_23865 [bacterium]|nr:hypothetical protein [bacterium]
MTILSNIQTELNKGENLADIVWNLEANNQITKGQIPAIIYTLLIEKYNYSCLSFNLSTTLADWEKIHHVVKTWDQFDTVLAYYHPQLDVSLINPSNKDHWARIESLSQYELMIIFAKAKDSSKQLKELQFLADFKAICSGQLEKDYSQYQTGELSKEVSNETGIQPPPDKKPERTAADDAAPSQDAELAKGARRITPKYGVPVTNELFHNGNVEAWRNIIESYEKKYVGSTILLFHNGQRIKHISSLFKWGKVKTGDSIFFSIVGEEIKDVAKLKKYLYEGASHNFKYFVKKDVNLVLSLF